MGQRMRAAGPFLMAWVEGRGGGHAGTHPIAAKSLSELTAMTREWIEEDRAKGRPSSLDYAADLFADGARYFDRQRKRR